MRKVALVLFLVGAGLSACRTGDVDPAVRAAQSAKLQELRERFREVEGRLGPDAYGQPEAEALLRALVAHRASDGTATAIELDEEIGRLRARIRLAREAQEGEQPTEVRAGENFGPAPVKGAPPRHAEQVEAAKALGVGTTRAELLHTHGSCLVRQTWFRGRNGGPTLELYQVAPECRDRLQARVFTVSNERVTDVSTGNLDGVMTTVSKDRESNVEREEASP